MNNILINLVNEEHKHNGNIFIQPDLKCLENILNSDKSTLEFVDISDAYIVLGVDSNITYNNNQYIFSNEDIKFITINPPKTDRSRNKNFHRMCLEITIAGRYIPVYDLSGKLLFTKEHFDYIRNQMNGLSYYNMEDSFVIAEDNLLKLPTFELNGKVYNMKKLVKDIEKCTPKTEYIRSQIIESIESKINEDCSSDNEIIIDEELHNEDNLQVIEMIDIGSTGRGTNIPGTGDFDFMFRISDSNYNGAVNYYKSKILDLFGLKTYDSTDNDLRLKDVYIQGTDEVHKVDIDITFAYKNPEVYYPTEMCLQDRLNTIKDKYPDKYNYVLANIIIAKLILKDFGSYKKRTSHDEPKGGMGGVGIETWVLEHDGSFTKACQTFLEHAMFTAEYFNIDMDDLITLSRLNPDEFFENVKADSKGEIINSKYQKLIDIFKFFQAYYPVYDFGQNHIIGKANSRRKYPHDDFIYNMNAVGFYKMLDCIIQYKKVLEDLNKKKNR